MKKVFRSADIVSIIGVPYTTLNYWMLVKLIAPSVAKGRGRGTDRLYSEWDLVRISVAYALSKQRLPLDRIRAGLATLQRFKKAPPGALLIQTGYAWTVATTPEEVSKTIATSTHLPFVGVAIPAASDLSSDFAKPRRT